MNKTAFAISGILTFLILFLSISTLRAQQTPTPEQLADLQRRLSAKITKTDWQLILRDISPENRERFEAPEMKQQQIQNFRELLALANQAVKEGVATGVVFAELEYIRIEITAVEYDKRINKSEIRFSSINRAEIDRFYADRENEAAFGEYLKNKIALAKENGNLPNDRELSADETAEARENYAKIRIYEKLAEAKKNELGAEFVQKVAFNIKLQQAQFLARIYTDRVLSKKTRVPDEEIQRYITSRPELNTAPKRAKAQRILLRARAGENFAILAKRNSEDPGSKDKGGLYENVSKGTFNPAFETAALALRPGQIAPKLVETPYGFHIIKLEKKGIGTYNVRHILISTMIADPENPTARSVPVVEYVRNKLETERERKLLDEILKNNPVEIESY